MDTPRPKLFPVPPAVPNAPNVLVVAPKPNDGVAAAGFAPKVLACAPNMEGVLLKVEGKEKLEEAPA